MKLNSLHDVLLHEVEDLYSAEQQIAKALPKIIKRAKLDKLQEAFEKHLEQTKKQIKRLEEAAKELEHKLPGKSCKGMQGLLAEAEDLLTEEPGPVLDAALISAAQRVEHYEIAAYGSAVSFAKLMRHKKTTKLLKETLNEEEKTDKLLSKLAESIVNEAAL